LVLSLGNYEIFERKFGEYNFYYVGDNTFKDFISPNKLGLQTICLIDNGTNIYKQNFNLPQEYLPKKNISSFHD